MVDNVLCMKCGNRFPASQVKYLHQAKSILCLECIEKIKKPPVEAAKEPIDKDKPKKNRFKCLRCNHVFLIKENFSKVCPFCASRNLTTQDWNSDLDNLIKDAGQKIYDN